MEPQQTDVENGTLGRCSKDNHVRLYKAALQGDWKSAHEIYMNFRNCFSEIISKNGNTALHIAAEAGQHNFIKELLAQVKLADIQLAQLNNAGNTAYSLAAASGMVEVVTVMENHNQDLPNICGRFGKKPIQMAAMQGREKVVDHLLTYFDDLSPEDRIYLLITVIEKDLYDVALKILEKDGELAIKRDGSAVSALLALARKTPTKSKISNFDYIWNAGSYIINYSNLDYIKLDLILAPSSSSIQFNNSLKSRWRKQEKVPNRWLELVQKVWKRVISEGDHEYISNFLWCPPPGLLFEAIEVGNNEFIEILINEYPDIIWEVDLQEKTIFHVAVEHRQEKIFSHIFNLKDVNHLLTAYKHPKTKNNILHLAASLPCSKRLDRASGAALQMQQELLWFRAVESIVPQELAHAKNFITKESNGNVTEVIEEKPREMYTRLHIDLRKEGEKWMRSTANSCMVVATLVAGMVFQAVFQLPDIKNKTLLYAVVMSDALSLLSSTASILTFLAILCSAYSEEDFLVSLPFYLMVGFAMLLFSVLTMLLSYTTTVIFVLRHNKSGWIIVAVIAYIVGSIYMCLHFPLLVTIYRSTYGAKYLFRPRNQLIRD